MFYRGPFDSPKTCQLISLVDYSRSCSEQKKQPNQGTSTKLLNRFQTQIAALITTDNSSGRPPCFSRHFYGFLLRDARTRDDTRSARTHARAQASQRNTEYGLLGKTNTAGKSFRGSYQMSDFSMAAAAQQDHARLSDHEREVLKSNSEESARTPLVRAVLKKASCKFWKRLCCYCTA